MDELDSLRARMTTLDHRIGAARERIALHSTAHLEHAATLDELTERYAQLQDRLNAQTASLESEGVHVDSFEKTVLEWVNGLTFSH